MDPSVMVQRSMMTTLDTRNLLYLYQSNYTVVSKNIMSSRCYCVSGKSWRRCYSQVVLTTPIVLASTRFATHLTIQTAPSVTTTTALQVNIIIISSSIITFNIFSLSRIFLSTFVKYSQASFAKKNNLRTL